MASPNITNIPAPRVELIDPRTGLMAREWYRFFLNLFNLTGGGSNVASIADLQVGPPANETGLVAFQAQDAALGLPPVTLDQIAELTKTVQGLTLIPATPPAIPTTPAGSDTQIQYNSSGVFGASATFTYDASTHTMQFASGLTATTTTINTAAPASGAGNPLSIIAGDGAGTVAGSGGGNLTFQAGTGSLATQSGTSNGGSFTIQAGKGGGDFGYGVTGTGGGFYMTAGDGGDNADYGNGGGFTLLAGNGVGQANGDGGGFNMQAGAGSSTASTGNGGGFILQAGNATGVGNGGNLDLRAGTQAGGGTNGNIYFRLVGGTVATYSGTTKGLSLGASTSGVVLDVAASGTAGTAALQVAATSAGNPAIRVNSSATTGVRTATFTATNKPGANNQTTPSTWLPINIGGTVYYIPCFAS